MAVAARTIRGHVIFVTVPSWGHVKSACALIPKLVRQHPVHATLFVASPMFEKTNKEIDSKFPPGVEDDLRRLIRVIPLESGPDPFDFAILDASFLKEYEKLFDDKRMSNDTEPGPPQLVLLDLFHANTLQNIRGVSGHKIPIYTLMSGGIAAVVALFGPGGRLERLSEELKSIPSTNRDAVAEEAARIYMRVNGKLFKVPGIPPMYDHEYMPQTLLNPKILALMMDRSFRVITECDGAVMNSTTLFEGESIKAFREWFGKRPAICAGPFDYPLAGQTKAVDPKAKGVESFLDSAMEKYGQNSVVYISLGTAFWPSEPEKLWAILDVLIEQKVPFMLAHASRSAVIPDEVKEKIKASGLGYSSNWLPQTVILNHKACGWILSHAGQNSLTEALSAGVPMVCWPFEGDQPMNATYVASVHNLGYELFEVRTGTGLGPVHRLGDWKPEGTVEAVKREFAQTLEKMRGEDGSAKRASALKFRDAFAKLWAPGGENWQQIKKISSRFIISKAQSRL